LGSARNAIYEARFGSARLRRKYHLRPFCVGARPRSCRKCFRSRRGFCLWWSIDLDEMKAAFSAVSRAPVFPVTQASDTCPSLPWPPSVKSVREDEGDLYLIGVGRAFGSSLARRRSCHTHPACHSLSHALSPLSPLITIKYEQVRRYHKLTSNVMSNWLIRMTQGVGGMACHAATQRRESEERLGSTQ
jgi:hypothetical protein